MPKLGSRTNLRRSSLELTLPVCLKKICRREVRRAISELESFKLSYRARVDEETYMLNVAIVEAAERLSMHDEAADLSTLVSSLKVLSKQQREFAGELN